MRRRQFIASALTINSLLRLKTSNETFNDFFNIFARCAPEIGQRNFTSAALVSALLSR